MKSMNIGYEQKSLKTKNNASKTEFDAIQPLNRNKFIKILPSNKSNASVILDKESYSPKISAIIQNR